MSPHREPASSRGRVTRRPPPERVLAAFGVRDRPIPLTGGMGRSWRAGDVVLKPLDVLSSELEWLAAELPGIRERISDCRVSAPIRSTDGALAIDGWTAWELLDGRHEPGRWSEIVAVGERLSAALAPLPRPAFIDEREHPWAVADRVAWGELPLDRFLADLRIAKVAAGLRPLPGAESASGLVHGDLTGNVLFADGMPPAVIDLSLYWRPAPFPSAVVVADALVWEGADASILAAVEHVDDFGQHLLRALVYRLVTEVLLRGGPRDRPERYEPATALALRLASREGPIGASEGASRYASER